MRPLTPQDPRAIGTYRPLARLGAGGMGVVYLARSPAGELAAVKVIHAGHVADPAFRARFRREAEAAGRVTGPGVVPVTGADTEAGQPWLATEFVPGPSLAETVAAQGPLPPGTVRTLGVRLARVLAAAHGEGLVHRDVKPGNVLLTWDGPRLIDFGIARHLGATALTATGALLGTPGYLAPEQAAGERSGPPCDVFALGCVLAFAATGRRPFGDGPAAGVLFRTVHEEPRLRGLPPGLRGPVTACLAKDPGARPTARQAEELLAAFGPGTEWRVPGLSAVIAERSAAALALPDPGPPEPSGPPAPATPPATRRRLLLAGAAGAVLLAGGGTAALVTARRGTGGTSGTAGTLPTWTIGLHADLSGPGRALGLAHRRGVLLAVADHNSRTGAAFRLALRTEDDGGTTAGAERAAARLIRDTGVLAVVGPTLDTVPKTVADRYGSSRLAVVTVSTATSAGEPGGFPCAIRPADEELSTALIHYLARVRPATRIRVVEDREDEELSWAIAHAVRDVTFGAATVTVDPVEADQGFGPAAGRAVAAGADAVVHAGGSPARAARCARALAAVGYTGTRLSSGPVLSPVFLREAGEAAEGWVFAQACTDPSAAPSAKRFAQAHRRRFGAPPAYWAAEAYDAVGLIARAAADTSAGADAGRGGVAQRLFLTEHRGVSRPIAFRSTRTVRSETGMFLYRIEDGRARWLGPYAEVTADRPGPV
ncbi:bifunctional serine/threonine-protein kinase/ABC transporter substrate-binding protein [Streptomyces nitrosporeus]|uniref:bifunctional serine/threonine-protein kinase/ABC transporter substrate-binding protein n=1 Tax=Streptomyces nitrosporeus TaxID=28894 RepID=UPI0039A30F77